MTPNSKKFTWNVGVIEEDGEMLVAFQFGEGDNPITIDLKPEYALRISEALKNAAYDAR